MFYRSAVIVVIVVLGGCATAAQRDAQRSAAGLSAAAAHLKACVQSVYQNPRFAPLSSHSPDIETGQFTIEQLADPTVPSAREAVLLAERYDAEAPCRDALVRNLDAVRPDLAAIRIEADAADAQIIVAAAQRRISWGQAAREVQSLVSQTTAKMETAQQRWGTVLAAENQAELDRREAASAALLRYGAEMQAIGAAQQPIVTNCGAFGNTVNCVSR